MKDFLAFIGALVLIVALVLVGIYLYKTYISGDAGEFEIEYAYETTTDSPSDTAKYFFVKGYKGKSPENVVIPETADDNGTVRKVYGIKAKAFEGNKDMKTVEIPGSVCYFGARIFSGCENLTTITIKSDERVLVSGFDLVFDGLDLSKVTFIVENETVKSILSDAYPSANIQVK